MDEEDDASVVTFCCCGIQHNTNIKESTGNRNKRPLEKTKYLRILHGIEDYLLDTRSSNLDDAEHRKLAETFFPAVLKQLCDNETIFNDILKRRSALIDAKFNLEIVQVMIDAVVEKQNSQTGDTDQNRLSRYSFFISSTTLNLCQLSITI